MKRLALVLLLACVAAADELYVLPIAQSVGNARHVWRSEVLVANPHGHEVKIEVEVFGELRALDCDYGRAFLGTAVLKPHETRLVCVPFRTFGAVALRASDTIVVDAEMLQVAETFPWTLNRQQVEAGRRWFERGEAAMIFGVDAAGDVRSNLIVVNPNAEAIRVTYVARRMSFDANPDAYEPVTEAFDVPPRGVVVWPMREGPLRDCGDYDCGSIKHSVRVTATGRFFVAASTVIDDDATYRNAVAVTR